MSDWDGVPPNPEQSSWHWLQEGKRDPQPFEWCSSFKNWWLGGDEDYGGGWQPTAKHYRYLEPCLTPAEIAAKDARIAELETLLKRADDIANWTREDLIYAGRSYASVVQAYKNERAAALGGKDEC